MFLYQKGNRLISLSRSLYLYLLHLSAFFTAEFIKELHHFYPLLTRWFCFLFFHIKGDQASIIGGVIEFIKELHQVLQSLESKKRRKSLSPSPGPSPRALQLTSQPDTPFGLENFKELGACCNSSVADVEAKISGSNVILRIISRRIPGQIVKIINVLEKFSFEVLHLNISSMEETVLYSFVIKVCISHGRYSKYQNFYLYNHPRIRGKTVRLYSRTLVWKSWQFLVPKRSIHVERRRQTPVALPYWLLLII